VSSLLEPIGFLTAASGDDVLVTTVPTFRPDTATETDIIEEVARHYGYAAIARTVPRSPDAGHLSIYQQERRDLRASLAGAGFNEIIPMPFLAPDAIAKTGLAIENPVTLVNPLAAEEGVLRPSLLPGVMGVVGYNESHRNLGVRLFEIGHIFLPPRDGDILPDESEWLAIAIAGEQADAAKRAWDLVAGRLGLEGVGIENRGDIAGMHPTRAAAVVAGNMRIGMLGEVDPDVLEAWGISQRVAYVEVQLEAIMTMPHGAREYRLVSTHPSSDIDLAFVTPNAVSAAAVETTLRAAAGEELMALRLFDVFRGGQLDDDTRSVAFALRLQAGDHTLTEDEIGSIRQNCIDAVEAAHGAKLRA